MPLLFSKSHVRMALSILAHVFLSLFDCRSGFFGNPAFAFVVLKCLIAPSKMEGAIFLYPVFSKLFQQCKTFNLNIIFIRQYLLSLFNLLRGIIAKNEIHHFQNIAVVFHVYFLTT